MKKPWPPSALSKGPGPLLSTQDPALLSEFALDDDGGARAIMLETVRRVVHADPNTKRNRNLEREVPASFCPLCLTYDDVSEVGKACRVCFKDRLHEWLARRQQEGRGRRASKESARS